MQLIDVCLPALVGDVGQMGLSVGHCGLVTVLGSLPVWTAESDTMSGTPKLGLSGESLTLPLRTLLIRTNGGNA